MLIFEILVDIQVSVSARQAVGYEAWQSLPVEGHQFVVVKNYKRSLSCLA